MALALLLAGLATAFRVSWTTLGVVVVYVVLTSLYSTWLKLQPVVDVFALAALYVLRVVGGGVAAGVSLTSRFLVFALFLFLSLAFLKRFAEVTQVGVAYGRGYVSADAAWMQNVGVSSGYMAAFVLGIYVTESEVTVLYGHPNALLLLCPLLTFWLSRMWFKAGRTIIHDDPVVETLQDPVAYVCATGATVVLLVAL